MSIIKNKKAIVIGAGPGGLTAAYEMLARTDIAVVVLEKSGETGGISRTVNYKGNRMDIGGHRFFSKSKRVINWWQFFMRFEAPDDPVSTDMDDNIMLIRNRKSRIFFLRKLFAYPIELSANTLLQLGIVRTLKITFSYVYIRLFPLRSERNLEDFFINRFGRELYGTFFKDYTQKVWGKACNQIQKEWGAQRIKGLSVSKAVKHSVLSVLGPRFITRENVETSLIDSFMYPRLGPGQLWDEVGRHIKGKGGQIVLNQDVVGINWIDEENVEVTVKDGITGATNIYAGNYLFSTMPVKDLISSMHELENANIKRIANGLAYRDFITVGLLLKKLKLKNKPDSLTNKLISDNWLYIQEKDVCLGRLQIFNNWSPDLVENKDHVWIGLEYFCNEGDNLWSMSDADFVKFAIEEIIRLNIIDGENILDSNIIRVPKAYPAYFGTYNELKTISEFTDSYPNMFLIGRNGMHKYNNQDHSMLTAMVSVDNIVAGITSKENIWNVNTENSYHESSETK